MPIPGTPESSGLTIEVTVRENKTYTQHRLTEGRSLTFRNTEQQPLVISTASTRPPFIEEGCSESVRTITVAPGSEKRVRIDPSYGEGSWFKYSARIGDAEPEDPIVIIDRR